MLRSMLLFLALMGRPAGPPDMVGLATYYRAEQGAVMRSGEGYDATGMTCAVDASEWARLAGHDVIVGVEGRYVRLRVADTGRLYDAGRFAYDARRQTWTPAEVGPRFVLDVPEATYRREIAGDGDTRLISVWIVGED